MSSQLYVLSCCTPADLSIEYYKKRNISYIAYPYYLGGKEYMDDLGLTMSSKQFYDAMASGADTKTSQSSTEQFIEHFTPFLEQGLDILHVCLSSGLTGVMNSAMLARSTLLEKYPDRKIMLVDSLGASRGYGLFMDKLADFRDEGMSLQELYNWAMENRLKLNHWFYSTDLTYYVRGGRVTKAAGWFGTMLNICPLLNMDNKGHLIPRKKCRGKKNVMQEIVNAMVENADDGLKYSDKCFISHADCLDEAKEVASVIEKKFPKLKGKVEIESIGPIIGSHTGPGTVAVFFWGKERKD